MYNLLLQNMDEIQEIMEKRMGNYIIFDFAKKDDVKFKEIKELLEKNGYEIRYKKPTRFMNINLGEMDINSIVSQLKKTN